ncbi:formate dehydrogenase gamma subunit [Thermodesulfobium narugense DSM 14796]|uniref:Formate dehydrogenase gamma subunit n=1 Tax=Thermodesulfobium narugense DSM 14796 TaxID=747365 RepID=M1E9D9_9BACT|nr:cytochrome b/b6 domain-containing protein [Thermodesulfobium narugense]AEE15129.1 formate dehydrogenase gamma subunit [Thermodesulfobium narugense DSM 14796]
MDNNEKVLRFPVSEKVFHNVNAITWYILAITGILVFFKLVPEDIAGFLMQVHIWTAIIFTLNLISFILISPDRFYILLRNLLKWDKDSLAWFKNLGGYPRKFGIPFGPEETAPQGKYNTGQQLAYLLFIFMIFGLIVSGWALYLMRQGLGKEVVSFLFYFHVWGSIITTILVTVIHLPLSLINFDDFKAMWRLGSGYMPYQVAKHHSPKWVKEDLIEIGHIKNE